MATLVPAEDTVVSSGGKQYRLVPADTPRPDMAERIAGSTPVRFAIGAAEPVLGAAQLVANMLPGNAGQAVNDHLTQLDRMINKGRGGDGFDLARFGGNVLSPVNAGIAKIMPAGATTLSRAATGAGAGAIGGASSTVSGDGDYWRTKAAQTGLGAIAGVVATPLIGKFADAIAPRLEAMAARFNPDKTIAMNATASMQADDAINKALKEIGANPGDFGAVKLNEIRQQVLDALKSGKQIDAAALARKMDFQNAGVEPTLGQVTRDATQFARERNLRGVPGVGEPLQTRFDTQNQQLQQRIGDLRGTPSEPYRAGQTITDALSGFDSTLKSGVDSAYAKARDHLGRAAPMDPAGFSKAANLSLDDGMLGSYLPAEVRTILNDVSTGKIPFNVNTAVQIDSVLSGAQRAAGSRTPQSLAIGKVRDALNSAGIADNVGSDAKAAFDAARKAAAGRFGMHDAIPALKAAAEGDAPDAFVRNYIINGKVDEVNRLAKLLKTQSPEAFNEARAQIGDKITRAAFGENVAGDKLAAPERLARELRNIGTDKLAAFYSPEEIAQFKTLSRVAAYINSAPSSAPVNTSNNIGAITRLSAHIPGIPASVSIAHALRNTVGNAGAVKAGVNAQVPMTRAPLTPEQSAQLARLLTFSGVGAGAAAGSIP